MCVRLHAHAQVAAAPVAAMLLLGLLFLFPLLFPFFSEVVFVKFLAAAGEEGEATRAPRVCWRALLLPLWCRARTVWPREQRGVCVCVYTETTTTTQLHLQYTVGESSIFDDDS